jgi:hypothetical protein
MGSMGIVCFGPPLYTAEDVKQSWRKRGNHHAVAYADQLDQEDSVHP